MWINLLVTILCIGYSYGEDLGKNTAIFLSMLGDNRPNSPLKMQQPLAAARVMVDNEFIRYGDVKHVIPLYCDNVDLTRPYIGNRVNATLVNEACTWLRLTTAKFLIRYGTPTPTIFPKGKTDRIVWRGQSIAYTQVEWLIPNVCKNKPDQHPFTETQLRLLDEACSFFFSKIEGYLLAISPRPMNKDTLQQRIDQYEDMTLEQATPIIRYICIKIERGEPYQGSGHLSHETCEFLKEIGGY